MVGDAASLALLGRSWEDVEQSAVDYLREAEAAVVRWAWCGPEVHLWELREPVAGHEESLRIVAEDPGAERRHRFAHFGYGPSGAIVLARRFTDHWAGRFDGTHLRLFEWTRTTTPEADDPALSTAPRSRIRPQLMHHWPPDASRRRVGP